MKLPGWTSCLGRQFRRIRRFLIPLGFRNMRWREDFSSRDYFLPRRPFRGQKVMQFPVQSQAGFDRAKYTGLRPNLVSGPFRGFGRRISHVEIRQASWVHFVSRLPKVILYSVYVSVGSPLSTDSKNSSANAMIAHPKHNFKSPIIGRWPEYLDSLPGACLVWSDLWHNMVEFAKYEQWFYLLVSERH